MNISTVEDDGSCYTVTLSSGLVQYVPKDPQNADYARVQAWVEAGGIITQ
jgi:hypothetical protein